MCRLILDAGPLITTCKFSVGGRLVIDHLLDECQITVTASVRDEVVLAGNRYADATAARQRIDAGRIGVVSPRSNLSIKMLIVPYGLGTGEMDCIQLAGNPDWQDATLVVDDHLAYLVSDRLGQRKRFLMDVIADLVRANKMAGSLAVSMVQAIRPRYPPAFVEHTLLILGRS
jgi:hypothetical protein